MIIIFVRYNKCFLYNFMLTEKARQPLFCSTFNTETIQSAIQSYKIKYGELG